MTNHWGGLETAGGFESRQNRSRSPTVWGSTPATSLHRHPSRRADDAGRGAATGRHPGRRSTAATSDGWGKGCGEAGVAATSRRPSRRDATGVGETVCEAGMIAVFAPAGEIRWLIPSRILALPLALLATPPHPGAPPPRPARGS